MKEPKIAKLTHEAYGERQTIEFSAECDIHEYIDQIERLLMALSFMPETVKQGFIDKAEEIETRDIEKEQEAIAEENEEDLYT